MALCSLSSAQQARGAPFARREYACEQNVVIGVLMVPLIACGYLKLTVISNMALSGALGAALRDGD